ncbi:MULTISPECIES: sulfite exporter TauE/SafE family protein [Bordetella]|uniref:Probable membrane transporter protein n=2 Tax=Bordetella TaxID=517 RepID=A0A261VPV7_9BORD|nr:MULTISPECIES: sulfite exporter TauE/SafE family protein [Bordetella]MDM9559165.1 sulfite exporter TauE/SafE family protein [Bordetella petrii]OZI76135.1 anion permease [Bordetella genomosp. 2]
MDVTLLVCLLALGAVVGFAAGLLGIGGGMLLVPFLTMLFAWKGMPQDLVVHAAIATSMTSILFTSISSVRAHQRKGTIQWKIVFAMAPGIILGGLLAGGAVFAALSTAWLSLFFAVFVGYSAWSMLRNKKPKPSRQMPGVAGTTAVGAGIGFLSGLVGAGGGFLSVPFMVWCNVALHAAVSTSAALGFPIALANSVGYVVSGLNQGAATYPGMLGYIYWPALLALVATSVLTAPAGAHMAHRLPVATLKRVFACLLFALAAYMLAKAWQAFAL